MSHVHELSYVLKADDEGYLGLVEQIPAIIIQGATAQEVHDSVLKVTDSYIHGLTGTAHASIPTHSVLPHTSAGTPVARKQFKIECK